MGLTLYSIYNFLSEEDATITYYVWLQLTKYLVQH